MTDDGDKQEAESLPDWMLPEAAWRVVPSKTQGEGFIRSFEVPWHTRPHIIIVVKQ